MSCQRIIYNKYNSLSSAVDGNVPSTDAAFHHLNSLKEESRWPTGIQLSPNQHNGVICYYFPFYLFRNILYVAFKHFSQVGDNMAGFPPVTTALICIFIGIYLVYGPPDRDISLRERLVVADSSPSSS